MPKNQTQSKALDTYLRSRHSSLTTAATLIGMDQELVQGSHVSDDIVGRIARLYSLTPERLRELAAIHATPEAVAAS